MKKEDIKDLSKKMTMLKQINPLKFAELKGRIDAVYDMQTDEYAKYKERERMLIENGRC